MINIVSILCIIIPFAAPRLTIKMSVVDESGAPISGATATVRTCASRLESMTERESQIVKRLTGEDGTCALKLTMYSHSFDWWVEAPGYYARGLSGVGCTDGDDASTLNVKLTSKIRDIHVILKKIINPQPMVVQDRTLIFTGETNGTWRIDLERMQLMPPYGKGRHADAELTREWKGVNGAEQRHGLLRFLDEGCGVYKVRLDKGTEMRSVYSADVKAGYIPTIMFDYDDMGRIVPVSSNNVIAAPINDEYIVYRIRLNSRRDGTISAHYGKIYGAVNLLSDSFEAFRCYFNPRVNDTNLEDDPKRNIEIEDYRRMLDEVEKAKK